MGEDVSPTSLALIDSGCEHVLAAPWLANAVGEDFIEWRTEVGFVDHWRPTWPILVGQVGFIDRFTVTMSRLAQQAAVEAPDSFDRRFGVAYAT